MGVLGPENARLILKGWLDDKTKLSVGSAFGGAAIQAIALVTEIGATEVKLESSDAGTLLLIRLDDPNTRFWYFEPREFSSDKEFVSLLSSLPDADKYRSAVGISFFGRVTAPNSDDLLVPLGKVVLMALWD